MTELLVADVHLNRERPEQQARFVRFVEDVAATAERLYILGDLFDVWTGRRHLELPDYRPTLDALSRAVTAGCDIQLLHGNRDFYVDRHVQRHLGIQVRRKPVNATFGPYRAWLCHGDQLCTSHAKYRILSFFLRSRPMIWAFQRCTQESLYGLMEFYSGISRRTKKRASRRIIGFQDGAIQRVFRKHEVDLLICGHAHRGFERTYRDPHGRRRTMLSMPDFHDTGIYLEWTGECFTWRRHDLPG